MLTWVLSLRAPSSRSLQVCADVQKQLAKEAQGSGGLSARLCVLAGMLPVTTEDNPHRRQTRERGRVSRDCGSMLLKST